MFGGGSVRFRTTDFFGIVLPGCFLVVQVALLVFVFCGTAVDAHALSETVKDLWAPSLVVLLFASYLVGMLFRTYAISDTEELCKKILPSRSEASPERSPMETTFPYREMLRKYKKAIWNSLSEHERASLAKLPGACDGVDQPFYDFLPPFGLASVEGKDSQLWDDAGSTDWTVGELVYNSWKARLCVGSPNAFELAESYEARTRFFFGMLWSARWSLRIMAFTAGVLWIVRIGASTKAWLPPAWLPPWWALVLVAVLVSTAVIESIRPMQEPARWLKKGRCLPLRVNKGIAAWILFWLAFVLESLLTPIMFICSIGWGLAILPSLQVLIAALLFLFLARRLREVRRHEVRIVYLSYVALALSEYRSTPPAWRSRSGHPDAG